MSAMTVYEEKLNASYLLIAGVLLFALAAGLVLGIILGEMWWLTILYSALTFIVIAGFFQMKIELSEHKLVVRFGFLYRKAIELKGVQACSPYKLSHPVRIYGGWGIRKGKDGTFALTQAFVNDGIKLETVERTFIISSRNPEEFSAAVKSVLP